MSSPRPGQTRDARPNLAPRPIARFRKMTSPMSGRARMSPARSSWLYAAACMDRVATTEAVGGCPVSNDISPTHSQRALEVWA